MGDPIAELNQKLAVLPVFSKYPPILANKRHFLILTPEIESWPIIHSRTKVFINNQHVNQKIAPR